MKLLDKEGRIAGRVNIIDFLVIIVSIGVVILGAFFLQSLKNANRDNHSITFDVLMQAKTLEFCESITIGEIVRESVRNEILGEVVAKRVEPAVDLVQDTQNGAYAVMDVPEKYDVWVTVRCMVSIKENSFISNTHEIKVGKQTGIKGRNYLGMGYVLTINDEGDAQ